MRRRGFLKTLAALPAALLGGAAAARSAENVPAPTEDISPVAGENAFCWEDFWDPDILRNAWLHARRRNGYVEVLETIDRDDVVDMSAEEFGRLRARLLETNGERVAEAMERARESERRDWAARELGLDVVELHGDTFVAVGNAGEVVTSRDDGMTWTQRVSVARRPFLGGAPAGLL